MFNFRITIIVVALVAIIFKFTSGISAMNAIKEEGETLLLKLRPVDPRAFMMGDFMALAYDNAVTTSYHKGLNAQGLLVLHRDDNNVGTFVRLENETELSTNEIRVKYARKRLRTDIGNARYYFQEGTAEIFQNARYGVFKVSPNGYMLLVGLADKNFITITVNGTDKDNP